MATVYKNVRQPDFNIAPLVAQGKVQTSWVGWCLAVARSVFNIPSVYNTAIESWNASKTKHSDYNPPENVYFYVYWSGGVAHGAKDCGHVAVAYRTGDNIKVWSSPLTGVANYKIYEGKVGTILNQITKDFGMTKYLGWTCDLNGYTIAEKVVELPATTFVLEYTTASGGKASFAEKADNVGELLNKMKSRMEKLNDGNTVTFTVKGK